MKHKRLSKDEEKVWVDLYWRLVDKGLSHIEAYTLTNNKIFGEKKRIIILDN